MDYKIKGIVGEKNPVGVLNGVEINSDDDVVLRMLVASNMKKTKRLWEFNSKYCVRYDGPGYIKNHYYDPDGDRYVIDFAMDYRFFQKDTAHDSAKFGVWANDFAPQIIAFYHGSLNLITFDDKEKFEKILEVIKRNNDDSYQMVVELSEPGCDPL